MRRWLSIPVFLLLWQGVAEAQFSGGLFDYNGYVKYLYTSIGTGLIGDLSEDIPSTVDEHQLHARLNTHWYFTDALRGEMDVRVRALYGGTVEHIPGYFESLKSSYPFKQLDWKIWEDNTSLGYAQIDRLYLDYTAGDLQTTVGRQRIAWGTSFAWNVIDIFNPKDVLDFDYEELPGADAVRVQYYTGPVTKVEAAYAPAETWKGATFGGLYALNMYDYDIHFIAGMKNTRWFGGAAWVGDIADAGFRGEVLVSESPEKLHRTGSMSSLNHPFFDQKDVQVSAVVSGDYTFPSSLYIAGEVLYNNVGVKEYAALYANDAIMAGLLTPARWSTYASISYEFHPLIKGLIFAIYNPDDESVLAAPQITWSVFTNFDLMLIAFYTDGKPLTEYGSYGDFYFLRGKWSF